MPQQYDNTNSGVLFKNDRKEQPNHPDYKGSANIGGVEYWVSAWIKTKSSDGSKFMSFSYKLKDERQKPKAAPAGNGLPSNSELGIDQPAEDEVPF